MIRHLGVLDGAIDYAGLFPPASLSLAEAMASYGRYRTEGDAWALGAFVIPAGRLREFQESANRSTLTGTPWPLSVIFPVSHGEGLAQVDAFLAADTSKAGRISAIEASPSISMAGEYRVSLSTRRILNTRRKRRSTVTTTLR